MAKTYTKWTAEDDKLLTKMYIEHQDFTKISRVLRRSLDAVQCRFVRNFIVPKYDKDVLFETKDEIRKLYNFDQSDFTRYLKYAGISEKTVTKTQILDNLDSLNKKIDQIPTAVTNEQIMDSLHKLHQKVDRLLAM